MTDGSAATSAECAEFLRASASLHKALGQRLSPLLHARFGVDLRLFVMMKRIEGGHTHPSALAKGAFETPSQITRQLDKLEALGLVRRTLDPADSRRIQVELTEQAAAGLAEVEAAAAEMLSPVMETLTPDERARTIDVLKRLAEGLQAGG